MRSEDKVGAGSAQDTEGARPTGREQAILRAAGAKYVSIDAHAERWAELWSERPSKNSDGEYLLGDGDEILSGLLARVRMELFPSVHAGECVGLEELAQKKERERSRRYYEAHKEERARYQRDYYKKNKYQSREYHRAYYEKNRAQILAKAKEKRQREKEETKK